uniref:Uncharacterized LOC103191155 n=1 Tax=Callorhinchus milii TaxID=7868 RepID=A0A4W3ID29_CALMI
MCEAEEMINLNLGHFVPDEGILILEGKLDHLESDKWSKYSNKSKLLTPKNNQSCSLVITLDDQVDGTVNNLGHLTGGDVKLSFLMYKAVPVSPSMSVVFLLEQGGRQYYLRCEEGHNLRFIEGEAPTDIENHQSDCIFYLKLYNGHYYHFESAQYRNWYICTSFNNGICKLDLKTIQKQPNEMALFCSPTPR